MDETFMALEGLDPETRDQMAEEAARRGIALEDYLAEVLRDLAESIDEPGPDAVDDESDAPDALQAPFSVRHRLEAIERRFASTMGGLSSEVRALDGAFAGLSARIDDTGALAEDTAETVNVALQEIRASVSALRKRVGDAERDADAYEQSSDSAYRALDQRLSTAESLAHGAHAATEHLADAQHALKHALAEDYRDLVDDTADRLAVGLAEARAAADAAAQRTDAAFSQVMRDLRATREAVDMQLAESAEQSRQRLQSAVRDMGGRIDTVALRVAEGAQAAARSVEDLALRVDDVERTAEAHIHAATAVWSQHADALRSDFNELREAHTTNLSRMKLTDESLGNMIGEISALSETLDRRLAKSQTRYEQALSDMQARLSGLDSRSVQVTQETAQLKRALTADIERVEACTLASLEKLSGDISAVRNSAERSAAESKTRQDTDIASLRDQTSDLSTRLRTLDSSFATLRAEAAPIQERLDQLEADRAALGDIPGRFARLEDEVSARAEADKTLLTLRRTVSALAARVETQHVAAETLRQIEARFAAQSTDASDTAERVDSLADVLSRFSEQSAEAATQAVERLQRLETSMLDWQAKAVCADETQDQLASIQQRVLDMEERQSSALELLRDQITDFMRSNEQRLAVLETIAEANVHNDSREVAADLVVFRTSIEDRIMGLESRSVRALEQIGDTIVLLEKRADQREAHALGA